MIENIQNSKILIVDDIPQNVRLLEKNLKSEGYKVISAYSGQEALDKIDSEHPDLVLLDLMMPVMDGHEVCRRIRENKKNYWIPIIMITAYESGIEKKLESLNAGADDFIKKPFDRYELIARVKSLLRIKQLQDELTDTNNRMNEELILAREVQMALLPQKYPDIPGLEFAHKYVPTLAIGGDFFDIQELSPTLIQVFICDVMGHGPQAAMITGIVKVLLNQLGSQSSGPDELLSKMNERFQTLMASSGLPIFITAFSMTINVLNGLIKYSNAGHPIPFIIKNNSPRIERMENDPGPALGIIPSAKYSNSEIQLGNGDMVFLFTDGLIELKNKDRVEFGKEEMQKAILSNMHLSPNNFVETIFYAAEAFSDGFSNGIYNEDDITLLAFSYRYMGVDE